MTARIPLPDMTPQSFLPRWALPAALALALALALPAPVTFLLGTVCVIGFGIAIRRRLGDAGLRFATE